eukprot:TRINITY_DN4630_c0_g3_i1.p1 TRINITY_DN4630_c0_g3~~TRINITY_DN4630_c0_g3_i1.p1  ORF type:complete len:676 (+),score=155.16 TRINITY_DN4630_c0_g3_i1:102-2129(+)
MSEVEPRNISALGDNDGDETTLEPGPGKERESEEEDPIDFVHRLVKESQSYWDMEQDSHPGYHSFGRPPENVIHSKEDRERLYALLKRGSLCNLSRKDRISAYLVFLQVSGRPLEQSRTVRTSLPPGARRWWRPTMMKEKAGMSSHVLGVLGGPLSTEKVEVLQRVLFSICDRFPSVVAATSFSFPQFIMKLFDDMEERNVIGLVTGFLEDNLMSECFFGHSPTQLHGTLSVIMQLVRKQVPALEGTLNYIGVHFSLILEPWIDTLFSQMIVALLRHVAVEFEGAKRQQLEECINAFWWRILDVIVCDGVSGPFKVAVSLIITLSDDLFRCESPENAMQSIVYGLLKIVIPPGDEIPSLNSKWEETIGSLEISGEELHLMVLRSMERFSVFRLPIMDPHVLRRDMYALSEEVMFSYYELMQLVQDIRMLHPYGGVDWEGFASIIENARGKVSTPVTLLKKMFRAFLRIQSVIVYDPAAVDSVVADILSAGRSMDHTNGWQTDEEEHMKGSSRHASMISTFTGTSDDSGEASIRDQDMESIIETSTMDGKSPARSQSTIDMSRTRAKELDGSLMRFPIDDIRLVSPSLPTEKIKLDHHAAIVGLSLMWNGSLDQKVDFLWEEMGSPNEYRLLEISLETHLALLHESWTCQWWIGNAQATFRPLLKSQLLIPCPDHE